MMLEQHQLSFEEEGSESSNRDSKKSSPAVEAPKHEKRDSGIAGLEVDCVKILEEPKVLQESPALSENKKASAVVKESKDIEDDDAETEEEELEGAGDADSTDTENEDATGIVTNIDDEISDTEDKDSITPPSTATVIMTVTPAAIAGRPAYFAPTLTEQPLPPSASTPIRPVDYSSLTRNNEPPSATFPRLTSSEHITSPIAMLPPGSSHTAPRLGRQNSKRRNARMEDITKLSILTRDLDITVSPPTPGKNRQFSLSFFFFLHLYLFIFIIIIIILFLFFFLIKYSLSLPRKYYGKLMIIAIVINFNHFPLCV